MAYCRCRNLRLPGPHEMECPLWSPPIPCRTCLSMIPSGGSRTHCLDCQQKKCRGCGHRLIHHRRYDRNGVNHRGSPLVCDRDHCNWQECLGDPAPNKTETS